jgi:hypothetical protein
VDTPEAPEEPKYTAPEKPTYTSKHDDEIDALYQQIMSRPSFSYDPMQDPLYGIMRDQAMLGGQMAMMDTQAQAANLTGGYGSSYGQQVGQQAYQGYLQDLNDAIPKLQEASRAAYDADTERMMLQYQMAMDNEDRDYSRFNDELSRYWADMEWNTQQDQWAYQVQQTERENLINMMAMGYTPTEEDLARAGMGREQANLFTNAYTASKKGSGGGGGTGGTTYKPWGAEQRLKLMKYWDEGGYEDARQLYNSVVNTFSGYDPADIAKEIQRLGYGNPFALNANEKGVVGQLPYVGANASESTLASETASKAWKEQALEKIWNSNLSYEEKVNAAIELGLDELLK